MASGQPGGNQGQYPQPPQQPGQYQDSGRGNPHLQRRPLLTKEEINVLEECNTESFWQRCVPIGLSFGGVTAYLVQTGYLKKSPRWGALPKSLGAMFVGYILGKLSYQSTCQDKILQKIPHSNLAQSVRKSRGMVIESDAYGMAEGESPSDISYARREEKMREVYSSMDIPSGDERRTVKELDDNMRPTVDRETRLTDQGLAGPQPTLTYDELRHRNRQEYERNMAASPNSPLRQRPFPGSRPQQAPAPAPSSSSGVSQEPQTIWDAPEPEPRPYGAKSTGRTAKNQWGDVWEE